MKKSIGRCGVQKNEEIVAEKTRKFDFGKAEGPIDFGFWWPEIWQGH
jgi:hypothetical protein